MTRRCWIFYPASYFVCTMHGYRVISGDSHAFNMAAPSSRWTGHCGSLSRGLMPGADRQLQFTLEHERGGCCLREQTGVAMLRLCFSASQVSLIARARPQECIQHGPTAMYPMRTTRTEQKRSRGRSRDSHPVLAIASLLERPVLPRRHR